MTIPDRDIMGGLAKGLAVMETFTADRPRQSIAEMAAACGLDRSTARRCLMTLAQQGYADYDGKFFTLTPRVLWLGSACLATMPLPQTGATVARRHLANNRRKLIRVDPRRGRNRLHRPRRHAQRHVHHPDAGVAPAGLLHLDGPRPAGRPA